MSVPMLILAILVALGSALMAGTFFAFSSFLMAALAKLPPAQGIAAMQQINVVVLNRSFLGTFLGTAALSLGLGVLAVVRLGDPGAAWFVGGALAYVLGTFGVTAAGNVPLNDRLAEVSATDPAATETWSHYLVRWTRLNTLRTVAALVALAAIGAGIAQQTSGVT